MASSLAIFEALREHRDVDALACVDLHSGEVLDAQVRGREAGDALEVAAAAAAQICALPSLASPRDDTVPAREALVVSDRGVHAIACAPNAPGRAVVALARPGVNVALLLASVRGVADAVREEDS